MVRQAAFALWRQAWYQTPMRYWLMKTEPDVFSFEDLLRARKQTTAWEGVRNYQARNFMRDDMRRGHRVFIYHSSCAEPGIMGIAEVTTEAMPDLTALDPQSDYYDAKSAEVGASRWYVVEVTACERFQMPISLLQLKSTRGLEQMLLVRRGQRLSVQPVSAQEWAIICGLSPRLPV